MTTRDVRRRLQTLERRLGSRSERGFDEISVDTLFELLKIGEDNSPLPWPSGEGSPDEGQIEQAYARAEAMAHRGLLGDAVYRELSGRELLLIACCERPATPAQHDGTGGLQ